MSLLLPPPRRAALGGLPLAALLALLTTVGCAHPEPTPTEQCERLVDVTCTRLRACAEELGYDDVGPQSECVSAVREQLPCGKVYAVGPSFDECIEDLEGIACGRYLRRDGSVATPANCQSVLYSQ